MTFLCTCKGPKWQSIKPDEIKSLQIITCQCSGKLRWGCGVLKPLCSGLSDMATSNTEASWLSFTFPAKDTAQVASPSPFIYGEGMQEDVFHSLSGRYVRKPGRLLRGKTGKIIPNPRSFLFVLRVCVKTPKIVRNVAVTWWTLLAGFEINHGLVFLRGDPRFVFSVSSYSCRMEK